VTQPFLPLFFGDFLASTAEWSGEERALYLLALSYQWSMGSLPVDQKRIAKLVDYERRAFDGLWETVSKKFVERDGRLYNLRLEQHRERSKEIGKIRSDYGRLGGVASGEARRRKAEANASVLLEANGKQELDQNRSNGFSFAEAKSNHLSHPIQELNPKSQKPASPAQVSDPKKAIFDLGVSLLGESKRALIGKAVSQVGIPKVSEVLGYLASHEVADRETYFAKATQPKAREVVC
jgi:uncharacterized protein YdaU (DUF1376 family)